MSVSERTALTIAAKLGGPSSRPDSRTSDYGSVRRNMTQDLDAEDEDVKAPRAALETPPNTSIRPRPIVDRTQSVARTIKQRSRYYVPVLDWLPNYTWSLFSGDLVAGVSLSCLLIPQSMSYANGLAHLTPVAGIWSTAIPAIVYGIFGTCRQLSLGPEAALSLLIGQLIQEVVTDAHHPPKHPEREAAAIALITTFQIGLITSALGLLRLGFLDVVLSRALLRGFITAVAIIIFIEQSFPMLGLSFLLHTHADREPPSSAIGKVHAVLSNLQHTNKPTAIMSIACLVFLLGARIAKGHLLKRPGGRWLRYVPEILLVVVGTTFVTAKLRLDLKGIDVLGKVSGGGQVPFGWPLDKRRLGYFSYTFPTAFVCAVVGIVDSIVAARENGSKYGYAVSPNRELVALGAANLAGSIMAVTGAIPVFGSITRSRLNGNTGGRTQISALVTACIMIGSTFLLSWLFFLPKAVLAVIVVLVVYTILNEAPHEIMFLWRMRAWTDFLQMTGTFVLTILFSIETGLVASVVFSLILVIQKSTQTRIKILGRVPHTDQWAPVDEAEDEDEQEEVSGVLVVRIREDLNFANTGQLKERLRRLELYGHQKSHPSDQPRRESAKAVILHMGDVDAIDASAIVILYELVTAYTERAVGVHFAHLKPRHVDHFRIAGITDICGPANFHRDLREAMKEIESRGIGTSSAPCIS